MRSFLAFFALSFIIQCIFFVVLLASGSLGAMIWAWPLLMLDSSPASHAGGGFIIFMPILAFFYSIGFGLLAVLFKRLWDRSSW